MRKTAWIWLAGFVAWVVDGLVSVHYRDWLHARLAFTVAMVFFVAALFYRKQPR